MIGIIGAMEMEVEGIKEAMTQKTVKTVAGIEFTSGLLSGVECVTARCSVGKVNAAACAQIMILLYQPSAIVNSGVAGGIGKGVHIGDVVIGTSCVEHDMDTTPVGDPPAFISGLNLVNLPCDERLSAIVEEQAKSIYEGQVLRGVIATGDQFISDAEKCIQLNEDFQAIACEMECGSIAHVCCMNQVPFVAIRSISDNANESGSVDYLTFARESAQKAAKLLTAVVDKL